MQMLTITENARPCIYIYKTVLHLTGRNFIQNALIILIKSVYGSIMILLKSIYN